MKEPAYKVVTFAGDAKVTLSGTARIATPEGVILDEVNLGELYPVLCPIFRTLSIEEGKVACITFHVDVDLPGIGKEEAA